MERTDLAHVIGYGVNPLPHVQGLEGGAESGVGVNLRIVPGKAPFLLTHHRQRRLNAALKLAGCLV